MATKTTKRALLVSVISLFVCFTMLIGTTYAWFTDSVTSAGNIIKTGTLKVALEYKTPKDTNWLDASEGAIFDYDKWEPGYTMVRDIRITNKGSLDLKYQLNIIPNGEVSELADVIDVYYTEGGADITDRAKLGEHAGTLAEILTTGMATGNLEHGQERVFTIVLKMQETADNEYQKLDLAGAFSVQLVATQMANEKDDIGADYDEEAWVEGMQVRTAKDLQAAISAGQSVKLVNDITLTKALEIPASAATTYSLRADAIVIDLNGNDIIIEAEYDSNDSLASSAIVNNGNVVLTGEGVIKATNNYTVRNYGTMTIDGVTVENGIMNFADLTVKSGNISNSRSGKHTIYGNNASLTINGGTFYNGNAGNAAIFSYAGEVVINDGEFSIADGTATFGWTSCLLDAQGGAKFTINGGVINGEIRDYNKNTVVNGGTFAHKSFQNFLAENTISVANNNGTWTVVANESSSKMVLADGAVLDLKGVEFLGTVVAEGDLTIKGDTKIKTLSATNGGTITIEDGKTLTLNNFSFGTKSTAGSEYTITGGTITANNGFFQHGTYALYSNFETGYMYYSYGSDITVYGTFHSQGKGDGLDYVRGKLTIANGGRSIHDKSLWVGQPASWGAMSAILVVEEGGYVQANSLSVYDGSVAYNSVANLGKENVGVKYNTLNGKIDVVCSNTDQLVDAINSGAKTVCLASGEYALRFTNNTNFNLNNMTIKGIGEVKLAISSSEAWYGRVQGSNVTFENIHFTSAVGATGKATYNNCAFDSWTICASSNKEETYFNNCAINGCLNTSTDFSSGDVYVKNCTVVKAEYSGSMTVNFESCKIGEVIIWNSNTNFTKCDVTTMNLDITTATITVDGVDIAK